MFRHTAERYGMPASLFDGYDFVEVPDGHLLPEDVKFGQVNRESGAVALRTIETAARLASEGKVDAICTAPVHKDALLLAGSRHPDHTELLAELTSSEGVTTLYELGRLRVMLLTKHVSLKEAIRLVTRDNLNRHIAFCDQALSALGSERRRIAVAALNPHAGENGHMGDDELNEIGPAVAESRGRYDVHGPLPADSVFHLAAQGDYDIVLSLFHDQGHIAVKTIGYNRTVAMNIGLPFLRTAVDHGPGFDRAGKGTADETNMIEAIRATFRYAETYRRYAGGRAR